MKKSPLNRKSKTPTAKIKDKCDRLLTPIVKKTTPKCEACGHDTEVGHHWIEKSRSLYLRFELENIIALCHSCHAKIHNRFSNSVMNCLDVAEIIIEKRGQEWFERMKRDSSQLVKANKAYFEEHLERLENLL